MKAPAKAPFDLSTGEFVDEEATTPAVSPRVSPKREPAGRESLSSLEGSAKETRRAEGGPQGDEIPPPATGGHTEVMSGAPGAVPELHGPSSDGKSSGASPGASVSRRGMLVAGASGVAALASTALAAQAVRVTTAAPALAGAAPLGLGAGAQAAAGDSLSWTPKFLTNAQARTLSVLCENILPRTDTPGAIDAGVPEWIDLAVSVADPDDQLEFLGGLAWIDQRCNQAHGHPFLGATAEQQQHLLQEISDQSSNRSHELEPGAAFFGGLKGRVLFAYFTSEKGRTEYLGLPDKVQREEFKGCQHDSH